MQSPELPVAEDHHYFPLLSGDHPLASPGANGNIVGQAHFRQLAGSFGK
jgi:hypothetical protein